MTANLSVAAQQRRLQGHERWENRIMASQSMEAPQVVQT